MECEICNLSNNNKNFIFETKFWKVYLAYEQYYLGRCVVQLKRHCRDFTELKKEELLDFLKVVKKLEKAIRKSFNPQLFNWSCLMNNAFKFKKPNPYIHFHVRPRYKREIEFAGLTFKDQEFAHHYDNKKKRYVNKDVLMKIKEKIKEDL